MNRDDPEVSDEELARLARERAGEPEGRQAAASLLARYRGRVYGWCRRYVQDHERALDLSQEVLMIAFRALAGYESRAPFSAWLFVIARRLSIRALRPRRLVRDESAVLEHLADPATGPEEHLERVRSHEELLRLMKKTLTPLEQEALWLRCVEGASVDDITLTLGLATASGARGLLQTARRRMRAALAARAERGLRGSS
jgi:RNA polymerase sigma-70 factor (ECF subfamily)